MSNDEIPNGRRMTKSESLTAPDAPYGLGHAGFLRHWLLDSRHDPPASGKNAPHFSSQSSPSVIIVTVLPLSAGFTKIVRVALSRLRLRIADLSVIRSVPLSAFQP